MHQTTHTQTHRQDRFQYPAPQLSAQCNDMMTTFLHLTQYLNFTQ